MIDKFNIWKESSYLTLSQAALLIMKEAPEDWDLSKKRPYGFESLLQELLEDAKTPLDDYYKQDDKGNYHNVYQLEIINRPFVKSFKLEDGFEIKVHSKDLDNWLSSKNKKSLVSILEEDSPSTPEVQTHSTAWLKIQNLAILEFFNPRRNPDAKKLEVVEWINEEAKRAGLSSSANLTAAIFSIIKPFDHDPKKKRVE